MKSNSIIDQNSIPGDDELNDEQSTLRTAKTMQVVNGVSHAKLVENRVTLQAPEPEFKSAGLQSLQDLMHGCDELRDEYIRITVTVSVLLQSPARVTRTPRRSS